MGNWVALFGFCLVCSSVDAATFTAPSPTPRQAELPQNAWSRVAGPAALIPGGATESIGFYSEGCIAGAKALPLEGEGYQVMRPSRNRYYGNPEMIQYVQNLGRTVRALGSSLLVSDMGQPRGGPMPYGHASHQVGLDVDIWFWSHPEQNQRSLTLDEREKLPMITVLNENGIVDPKKFGREQILKLWSAASSEKVQRIFVNPAIKVYLCLSLQPQERVWLHKLRPWPGHDSHFHVRLYCPAGDKSCIPQDEAPAGDGCSEVLPTGKLQLEEGGGEMREILLDKFFKSESSMPAACAKLLQK
jgi:penicillin-insensitive murein endopeptidase